MHSADCRRFVRNSMRSLLCFCSILILAGVMGTNCESPQIAVADSGARPTAWQGWRRTVDGWEQLASHPRESTSEQWRKRIAQIHPFVIAAMQTLLAIAGIVAYEPAKPRDDLPH